MANFRIHFGALCDPIKQQIIKQGFQFDTLQVDVFQRQSDSILELRFADLLTDSMLDKIHQRLYKQIVAHVEKMNKNLINPITS